MIPSKRKIVGQCLEYTTRPTTQRITPVIFLDWVNSGAPWWTYSLIGVDLTNFIDWMEWIRGRGALRAPN